MAHDTIKVIKANDVESIKIPPGLKGELHRLIAAYSQECPKEFAELAQRLMQINIDKQM